MDASAGEPSAEDLARAASAADVRAIESAIRAHHLLTLTYDSPDGPETVTCKPDGIRWTTAHHLVVWMKVPVGNSGQSKEYRLDRITSAVDTGKPF